MLKDLVDMVRGRSMIASDLSVSNMIKQTFARIEADYPDMDESKNYSCSKLHQLCPVREHIMKNNTAVSEFNYKSQFRMDFGSLIHEIWQKYLGWSRRLVGQWECQKCGEVVSGTLPYTACGCSPTCMTWCSWDVKKCPQRDCGFCGLFGGWKYKEDKISKKIKGCKHGELRGKPDGRLYKNKIVVPLELKTINAYGFDRLEAPMPMHLFQCNGVMELLDLKKMLISYIPKTEKFLQGDLTTKDFLVPRSKKYVDEIYRRMRLVDKYRTTGKKPKKNDRVCRDEAEAKSMWCDCREECFNGNW